MVDFSGVDHGMELSRLSSVLAIFGALNIFYALYGLIQMDWGRMLISTATYFALMYAAAILDSKSGEMAREREIETVRLQASRMGREVRSD